MSRSQLSLVLFLLLHSGCKMDVGHSDSAKRPLLLWTSQNPQERMWAKGLVNAWNRANPGDSVVVQPIPAGQSSEEVLMAAIVAGTTPDICANIWPGIVNDLARAGGVLRLDTLAGFDSLMQSRTPATLRVDFRSPDSAYYQIPWKSNPIMMLYNVRLFRKAGIDSPPRTYSEYLAAAKKITTDLNGDGAYDRWIGYRDIQPIWYQRFFDYYTFYIAASGGKTLFVGDSLAIDTTASNEVFSFFHQLYRANYFPKSKFQGNPFVSQITATDFTGPWNIAWLKANAPSELEFAYAPVPVPDDYEGPVHTYGDYKNIAIFSNTERPATAWRFARYLVSKQADLLLLEKTAQMPIREGLLSDSAFAAFFKSNPGMIPFAAQVPDTRGVEAVSSLPEVLDAVARQFEAASVYGVRSPAEATRRAIKRILVLQDWNS